MNTFPSKKWTNFFFLALSISLISCSNEEGGISIQENDHIILVGNNLASRMMNFGHFETELHLRYPDSLLYIRNMGDGGNTPGFRPHSGRVSPWAFPGAENFQSELATNSGSQGHLESPDEWITRHEADIIIAFFGYSESFAGVDGLENYKAELDAFIKHSLSQKYNGDTAPKMALVSPIAFQDLSGESDLPNGVRENDNLELYTEGMRQVAETNGVYFVDAFAPSKKWYSSGKAATQDGFQLSDDGYKIFSSFLVDKIFGSAKAIASSHRKSIHAAVKEKNWVWHNDFKIPNGVHVFGRRYDPFGPDNYPAELKKLREMTANRDTAIWKASTGDDYDLALADSRTTILPEVSTNYEPSEKNGPVSYSYGDDALKQFNLAPGYKIELFASEKEFPDLANPVQMSFDNKGRLWVAVMPSYPHYKPGDPKPDDKLLILEDTDGDYKADKQTVFADDLHLPIGFEFAPEGIYISQGTNLELLKDLDGDDKMDEREILLSGFDDHDTHHAISAFVTDPSGAIYMGEGVFLHTNVETPYGPVRATNGGFFRYNPQRRHLERTAQLSIPNPWGIAFDDWGQNFFAETSGPAVRWMLPGSVKSRYGNANHKSFDLIEQEHKVRPTSGLEFVSSRHFPDEVQGNLIINNTIGFLGTKFHEMIDDGTGYETRHSLDLLTSDDGNFRPVDMEFAPDGSLYMIDWHNVLIGHMQHNARDPLRDHVHGRVYRISYPSRPLVEEARVAGASIETLLSNLELPEYRTRYRSRRELRGRNHKQVLSAMDTWLSQLDSNDSRYQHHKLEALWLTWALNKVDRTLLVDLLESTDFRVRAAATRVLRYTGHQIEDQKQLLAKAASDPHGRVRLEAIAAASWLDKESGVEILSRAANLSDSADQQRLSDGSSNPLDEWIVNAHVTALAHINNVEVATRPQKELDTKLTGAALDQYKKGKEIYDREGYCITCHQADGKGLVAAGFPPLSGTEWVNGDESRLIKLTLKGLYGPMTVLDVAYPGQVPMTPFEGLLNDDEIASVLTFVRNSFGNEAGIVRSENVAQIRSSIENKKGFYTEEELLQDHPME